jgi:ABC-type transporter Mla subunit MlaD
MASSTLIFKAPAWATPLKWILALASDVALWLLMAACGLAIVRWADVDGTWHDKQQTMRLTISDANSLVKGSDVRLMGVTVGHVQRVKPIGSSAVEIDFSLNRDTPPIPHNAIATVVFSGLGGSKSVEFEVPRNTSTADAVGGAFPGSFKVETPVRLRESFQYQMDMSKAIEKGSKSLLAGLDRPSVRRYQAKMHQNRLQSAQTVEYMGRFEQQLNQFKSGLVDTTRQVNKVVQAFDKESGSLRRQVMDPNFRRKVRAGYRFSNEQAHLWNRQTAELLTRFQQGQTAYQQSVGTAQYRMDQLEAPLPHLLEEKRQALQSFDQQVTQLNQDLIEAQRHLPSPGSQPIEEGRKRIHGLNQRLSPVLERLTPKPNP